MSDFKRKPNAHISPAVEAMHRFIVWLVPTLEKFPRSQKFLLGDRIQMLALDVQDRLIEATYSRASANSLQYANLGLEKLRLLVRLAFDLKHLDSRRYEFAAKEIDQVGKLIGGWRRAIRATPAS